MAGLRSVFPHIESPVTHAYDLQWSDSPSGSGGASSTHVVQRWRRMLRHARSVARLSAVCTAWQEAVEVYAASIYATWFGTVSTDPKWPWRLRLVAMCDTLLAGFSGNDTASKHVKFSHRKVTHRVPRGPPQGIRCVYPARDGSRTFTMSLDIADVVEMKQDHGEGEKKSQDHCCWAPTWAKESGWQQLSGSVRLQVSSVSPRHRHDPHPVPMPERNIIADGCMEGVFHVLPCPAVLPCVAVCVCWASVSECVANADPYAVSTTFKARGSVPDHYSNVDKWRRAVPGTFVLMSAKVVRRANRLLCRGTRASDEHKSADLIPVSELGPPCLPAMLSAVRRRPWTQFVPRATMKLVTRWGEPSDPCGASRVASEVRSEAEAAASQAYKDAVEARRRASVPSVPSAAHPGGVGRHAFPGKLAHSAAPSLRPDTLAASAETFGAPLAKSTASKIPPPSTTADEQAIRVARAQSDLARLNDLGRGTLAAL
mgnify:CR=1 FL=1